MVTIVWLRTVQWLVVEDIRHMNWTHVIALESCIHRRCSFFFNSSVKNDQANFKNPLLEVV